MVSLYMIFFLNDNDKQNIFFLKGCINWYARYTMNPVKGKMMHDLHQATVEKTEYLKRQGYNQGRTC